MRHAALRLPTFLTALAIVALLQACATPASDASWPERTARIESMRPAAPIGVWVPLDRASRGAPSPSGTAALRMHVDAEGAVRQVAMIEGSGNAVLDAAAIRAMQTARFVPYQIDGVAVPVTVIAPMRFLQRRHVSPDTAPRFGF